MPEKPGYYRLLGNNQYTISVYGISGADYSIIIGEPESDNTQFIANNMSYNGGEGPKLGYGNTLQFNISKNTTGRGIYYAVPALGWSENELYERESGQKIELDGTKVSEVTIDNIDLTSGGNQTLYTKINLYTDSVKDELLSTINLGSVQRSNKPMPADLELKKSSNAVSMFTGKEIESNILYINNPETIAEDDIIKEGRSENNPNRLIYQQDNITNYNTLYITHSTKDMEDHPLHSFWYDVDFYSDTYVTIKKVKPYVRINNTWEGYVALKDLYLERLWRDHEYIEIEIEAGQHRLLFQDILPNEFGVYDEFQMQPIESFLALFVDFEVEAGKEITVSSLATDERDYLNLSFENNMIKAGSDNTPLVLDGSPFILAGRPGEYDTYRKMKGKEKGTTDVISGELKYIIDDNTAGGRLPIQITDDFYGESYTSYDSKWVANVNPIADRYDARLHGMPSNLFTYEYTDESGEWIFNFKYLNPKATTSAAPSQILNVMEESNYQNPKLNDTVLDYYRDKVKAGDELKEPYHIMNDQDTWEDYVMMMGNWGISYVYTIDIKNDGQNVWYIRYLMELGNIMGATYVVRDAETNEVIPVEDNLYTGITIDSTSGRKEHTILEIPIPGGKHYIITVSNLNGVGDTGFTNWLEISREKSEGNDKN